MGELRIERRLILTQQIAEQVHSIYSASFPLSEQVDFGDIVRSIARGDRAMHLAEEHGNVIGFALTKPLSCTNIHLLEYLAVAEGHRNRGVGGKLLQCVVSYLRNEREACGILIEVERPEEGSEQEGDLRRRRVEFYRRNGATMLEQVPSYRIPNLSGEGSLEMGLMWLRLACQEATISHNRLKDCIVSIYKESYGLSADDPLLQSVLQGIEA